MTSEINRSMDLQIMAALRLLASKVRPHARVAHGVGGRELRRRPAQRRVDRAVGVVNPPIPTVPESGRVHGAYVGRASSCSRASSSPARSCASRSTSASLHTLLSLRGP